MSRRSKRWHLIILLLVDRAAVRRPAPARRRAGLGRSLRIFKSEVKQIRTTTPDQPAHAAHASPSRAAWSTGTTSSSSARRTPGEPAATCDRSGPATDMAAPLRRRSRDPEGRMPLREHLRELRNRLLKAGIALVLGAVAGWFLYPPVYEALQQPISTRRTRARPPGHAQLRAGVADPFNLQLRMSLLHRLGRSRARSGCTSSGPSSCPG